jgi:hypothetical protein
MRKIFQNMGLKITEISEIMEISRPTMYKFIDMYENGEKEKIDSNVLKFFERVERNPKMQKKDALYYALLIQGSKGRLEPQEENVRRMVTATAVERPARRILLLRSKNAVDYMSYCEETGCEWESVMNAVERRFDDAAIVTLPKDLVKPGTSRTASGVEVPADHSFDIPKGYELIDLPPCTMLYMVGSPYDGEEHFCEAIEILNDALAVYDPETYGWKFDHENGISFNFGASAKKGARLAVPIRKL